MTLSLVNFGVGFRKVVRRLLEEQDKVLRSYFAQRGGMRRNGRSRHDVNGVEAGSMVPSTCACHK